MAGTAAAIPPDDADRTPAVNAVWSDAYERRILVLTGTDVHRFDRICDWADARSDAHPVEDIVVQHGFTESPRIARGVNLLTPDELDEALAGADVVVTHGGPGTISRVRSAGHFPIIVPRDPELGEHVDDHQLRFAVWAAERNLGVVVSDMSMLDTAVDVSSHAFTSSHPLAGEVDETMRVLASQILSLSRGELKSRAFPMLSRTAWKGRRSENQRRR